MSEPPFEVILTHEHTDFDALASLLGAALLYPEATPVLPRRLNRNVAGFLALYRSSFPFITDKDLPRTIKVTRAILVDARSVNWVRGMDKQTPLYIIDHHTQPGEELPPTATLHSEAVGANTTLLVEQLIEQQLPLSSVQATLLALGIHEDTGSLTYPSTTHRDARSLAWLMEAERGVNLEVVGRFLNHPLSEAQRDLLDRLIKQSEFHEIAGHTVVIAQAQAPGFDDELSALVGRLRNYHEADALFMLVGLGDMIQLVARSVTDELDVGKVAAALGGGGHGRAAAAVVTESNSLDEARDRVLEAVHRHARAAISVAQIMSFGRPQSLSPELSIHDAVTLMRRYGHEGFPVIRRSAAGRDELLGVLTRREADRAINHKMGDQPVSRFMRSGKVTIHYRASLGDLRRLMIESDWGQIPVVDDDDEIVGIVTRTDLIKLWDETTLPTSHAPAIAEKLQAVLSPQDLALLRLIGAEVDRLHFSVYIVGGFARDLLLNHRESQITPLDMDIVIEGDAIAFTRRLEALYGGRVVPHHRFNTAKWILDDPAAPVDHAQLAQDLDLDTGTLNLPAHLDFVSARTEFYTAPTVLPTVEDSSIKLDLHRRDFTINTLAICLNPARWGELLDFYGGQKDLEDRLIRVLHSLSFVDDATRILRAIRYEQRFHFTIEPRTLELLLDAVELLDRVSPARIRHELERILAEEFPENMLKRLDDLNILQAIHPALRMGDGSARQWMVQQFARIRQARTKPSARALLTNTELQDLYWGILGYHLSNNEQANLIERLGLARSVQQILHGIARLRRHESDLLEPDVQPSVAVAALKPVHLPALALAEVLYATRPGLRYFITAYLDRWRHIRPELDGNDLARLGIPRGPLYSTILTALRNHRLDGHIRTRDEEILLARQMAALAAE